MNEPPSRPGAPAPPASDKATDTHSYAVEATHDRATVARGSGSAPGSDTLPLIDEYRVIEKIGEGGMGAVYLAEDTKLGRRAALKTMKPALAADPTNRDRFTREARAAATVEHDNIVPIWRVGEATDGTPYIAMPFLQGEMLDSRLKREPQAPLGLLVKMAREVADGLAAAHAKGLIHRDIKPGNIWLEGDLTSKVPAQQLRRCKILDFGLARSVDTDDAHLTASGAILGTPAYMAPEQARGEKVDHRADLWSLGVMLYRMATGKAPFRGSSAMAVLIALTNETPPPVRELAPDLPPALAELIDRLMCKEPNGRPQSAAEVATTVRQIVKDIQAKKQSASTSSPIPIIVLPVAAPDPWEEMTSGHEEQTIADPPAPEPKARSRAPVILAGGVLGLLVLGVVLAVVIVRVSAAAGILTVEIDPAAEARFRDGKLVLVGPDGKERYRLSAAERNKTIDAGTYTARIEGADGLRPEPAEFTLKKNDKATVRVVGSKPPTKPPTKPDPDRKAAEHALYLGGVVKVNGGGPLIRALADLPPEPFTLTLVELLGTKVTDAGLANFKDCKGITHLYMFETQVSDAGLAQLKNATALISVHAGRTKITDAGLENFKNCTDLLELDIVDTQVGEKGLAHLKNCTDLRYLNLQGTQIGDTGLDQLKQFSQLTFLAVQQTKVTAKGVADFAKAMPRCRIEWDGGVIEPTVVLEPDRAAAEWVLSVGGGVKVNGEERAIGVRVDLPKGPFRLTWVYLVTNPHVSDAKLAVFAGCKHLTYLDLWECNVTDASMVHFKACKKLTGLYLGRTRVTDAGLAHFKGCDNLEVLHLEGLPIDGSGLVHFQNCRALKELWLRSTLVKDAALVAFKDCTELLVLVLGNSPIGDAGLAHFKGCKKLTGLHVSSTPVTDAGLAHFKDCTELTDLGVHFTKVTDAGLAHFKGCKNLARVWLEHTAVTDAALDHLTDKPLQVVSLNDTQITEPAVRALAKARPGCRIVWTGGVIEPKK